ncbi:hypothetical protein LMH87_005879 [Akanthomyces muscarius]|uniref:Uncharacterized protein n=1 Tax=Akanthomyces muscarius TaxID=2231603 RepID=A0A9W8QNG3_AKAMU|nr:hypothetical protein LMH87_005879 [Akanthomyces muscarius]KAJ4164195.1 hypothetical protein LMH87_005879 [Akanthomyces muscarius]
MPAESDCPVTTPPADDATPSMEPVLRRIANMEEAIANHHKDGLRQEASTAPSSSVDDISAVARHIAGMKSCLEAFREYISELRRLMRRARAADTGERRAASPAGDPAASRAPAPRQEGATSDTGVLVRKDHVFDTETEAVVSNAEHPAAQPPPTQRPPAQQFPAQGPFPEGPPAQYLPAQGPFPEGPPAQYFPSQQPFTRGPPFSVLLLSIFPLKVLFLRALRLNIFPLSILSLRALLFSVLQLSTFPTKVLFLRALLLRFKSASLSLLAMSSLVGKSRQVSHGGCMFRSISLPFILDAISYQYLILSHNLPDTLG